jgi:hypothetical protein
VAAGAAAVSELALSEGMTGDLDEELDAVTHGIQVVGVAVPHHDVQVPDIEPVISS